MRRIGRDEAWGGDKGGLLNVVLRDRKAFIGLITLLFFSSISLFANYLSPCAPETFDLSHVEEPPSFFHPLGTDALGRDVLSRFLHGGRVSLTVGFLSALIATVIGTLLGSVAGYCGGKLDLLIMRFTDTILAFPAVILAIVLAPIFDEYFPHLSSIWRVIAILAGLGWPSTCRLVRGDILSLKESMFVQASRLIGAGEGWIIRRHLIPGVLPTVVVAMTLSVANAILGEAVLSYLGAGVRPPVPSWGGILGDARDLVTITTMPWLWLPPGVAIMLVVLSINLIGEGLQRGVGE